MTFTDRLLQAARHAGVGDSQSDIARSLEITRQCVNRWFRSGAEPDADTTLEIARRWKISAEWLKHGVGDMLQEPGDGLTVDERELVKNYRSATPRVRDVISRMARAVRKSVVTISLGIPPLLAALHDAVCVLCKIGSPASTSCGYLGHTRFSPVFCKDF